MAKTGLSVQAAIAGTCYAIVILSTQLTAKTPPSVQLKQVGAAIVSAFVAVCVLNCYVSGGCGLLAWVFSAIMVVTAACAIIMTVTDGRETLIVRGKEFPVSSSEKVPFSATPP